MTAVTVALSEFTCEMGPVAAYGGGLPFVLNLRSAPIDASEPVLGDQAVVVDGPGSRWCSATETPTLGVALLPADRAGETVP